MELSDREIAHNHRNGSLVSQFDGIFYKKKFRESDFTKNAQCFLFLIEYFFFTYQTDCTVWIRIKPDNIFKKILFDLK